MLVEGGIKPSRPSNEGGGSIAIGGTTRTRCWQERGDQKREWNLQEQSRTLAEDGEERERRRNTTYTIRKFEV